MPAYLRDNSAVSALPASANGKTFATRGLSRPASHRRSGGAEVGRERSGRSRQRKCNPITIALFEQFLMVGLLLLATA